MYFSTYFLFRLSISPTLFTPIRPCVLVRASQFHGAHKIRVRPTFLREFSVRCLRWSIKCCFIGECGVCLCIGRPQWKKVFLRFFVQLKWLWNPRTKTVKTVSAIQLNLFHWISHNIVFSFFFLFGVVCSFRLAAMPNSWVQHTRFDYYYYRKHRNNNNNWCSTRTPQFAHQFCIY